MKRYLPHVKMKWYCFALAPMFMMLEACGEFILPYMNANIINNGAATGDIAYIVENGLMMALLYVTTGVRVYAVPGMACLTMAVFSRMGSSEEGL